MLKITPYVILYYYIVRVMNNYQNNTHGVKGSL